VTGRERSSKGRWYRLEGWSAEVSLVTNVQTKFPGDADAVSAGALGNSSNISQGTAGPMSKRCALRGSRVHIDACEMNTLNSKIPIVRNESAQAFGVDDSHYPRSRLDADRFKVHRHVL
jgi:hypothetical protein